MSVPGDEAMLCFLLSKSQVYLTLRGKVGLIDVKMKTMVAHNRSIFGLDNLFELFFFKVSSPCRSWFVGFYVFKTKIFCVIRGC